jgi:hypothetical protein
MHSKGAVHPHNAWITPRTSHYDFQAAKQLHIIAV